MRSIFELNSLYIVYSSVFWWHWNINRSLLFWNLILYFLLINNNICRIIFGNLKTCVGFLYHLSWNILCKSTILLLGNCIYLTLTIIFIMNYSVLNNALLKLSPYRQVNNLRLRWKINLFRLLNNNWPWAVEIYSWILIILNFCIRLR